MINKTEKDKNGENFAPNHFLFEGTATLFTGLIDYPMESPFNPPKKFAEYNRDETDESNLVYEKVRDLLKLLCLDIKNFDTNNWNPLGEIIRPGDSVVIKPNFVSQPRSKDTFFESIITHPSIIRAMIDYATIALKNKGEIIIADAPQSDSDIDKIKNSTKILEIIDFVSKESDIHYEFRDLRKEIHLCKSGIIVNRESQQGDPKGYSIIDLGMKSFFSEIEDKMNKIYGSDYNFHTVRKHHSFGKHEYCISNTILDADVILNLPKLKTHKKAGITGCLKNFVGINGDKNYLPHYRFGATSVGGDEYSDKKMKNVIGSNISRISMNFLKNDKVLEKIPVNAIGSLYKILYKLNLYQVNSGNWYGNDTIWRTIADINYIFYYSDRNGNIQQKPQRKQFCLMDGIIAGEGNGPLFSQNKKCGILLGGQNPLIMDICAAHCMGFDWKKIPTTSNIFKAGFLYKLNFNDELPHQFQRRLSPPDGWKDHIENQEGVTPHR